MGIFGNLIGQGLGALGSKFMPIDGVDGQKLGGTIGSWMPFHMGGQVGSVGGSYEKVLRARSGLQVKKHKRKIQKKKKC